MIGAASEVCGDTGVERAIGTVCHDVDPAAAHSLDRMSNAACCKDVDGRDKPTAVRREFCLLKRTALILLGS